MAILSRTCEYGLRAVLHVASMRGDRDYVPIREIAKKLGLSFHFLTKILQHLGDGGIVHSCRGPTGGVALARPAEGITLRMVIECIQGSDVFEQCVLGLRGCGRIRPCPLHDEWAKQRRRIEALFGGITVAALARGVKSGGLRLAG